MIYTNVDLLLSVPIDTGIKPMNPTPISLLVELPETLHGSLVGFLEGRPDWDQDRVFSAAISLFLLQNRSPEQGNDRQTARIYLDSIFRRPADAAS